MGKTMTSQTDAKFRQDAYTNRCLAHPAVLDQLQQQWIVIYRIERALACQDMEALPTAIHELNLELVRYALTTLRKHLTEAAIRDCADLIAERIFDTATDEPSVKRWEEWLTTAAVWPVLARENWGDALSRATDIVLATLGREGVALDRKAKETLLAEMAPLRLQDLLPESLLSEAFPEEADDNSGDDDA